MKDENIRLKNKTSKIINYEFQFGIEDGGKGFLKPNETHILPPDCYITIIN